MTAKQQPDQVRVGVLAIIAACFVGLSLVCAAIAWLLVAAPAGSPAARPSALAHDLIDRAEAGSVSRAAGAERLARDYWIDRGHVAHLSIERAIDAVVADPQLIGGHR